MDNKKYEQLSDEIFVCVSKEHRFGTDAFLLANFTSPRHRDRVCDLGTGCGIIPFVLEKKFSPKSVIGIDIQPQAIIQFQEGVKKSNLEGKITCVLGDLKEINQLLEKEQGQLDVVTCNPPYKTEGTGLLNQTQSHSIARHELFCTIEDVCEAAAFLLKFGGRFCLCQRPQRLLDCMNAMRGAGIEPKRLQFVGKNKDSAPFLFLLEGKKGGKPHLKVEANLFMYKEGTQELSEEIKQVYGGIYEG